MALLLLNVANGAARPLFCLDPPRYRARIHDGDRLWPRRDPPSAFIINRQRTLGIRHFRRADLSNLGRDLQLVPVDLHRELRPEYATTSHRLLYTAKGASAFLVPLANLIQAATGSSHMVFVVTAIMNFVVVGLGLLVLRPLRSRSMALHAYHPAGAE